MVHTEEKVDSSEYKQWKVSSSQNHWQFDFIKLFFLPQEHHIGNFSKELVPAKALSVSTLFFLLPMFVSTLIMRQKVSGLSINLIPLILSGSK